LRKGLVACALALVAACTSTGEYLEHVAVRPDPLDGVANTSGFGTF
jgi:hypothetical protein